MKERAIVVEAGPFCLQHNVGIELYPSLQWIPADSIKADGGGVPTMLGWTENWVTANDQAHLSL
jgi:hypothetical protein